jgi:hypothetical protein
MKTTFVCAPFCLRAPPPSAKVLDPVAGMHAAQLERLHSVPLWTCRRISPTSQRAISGTGRLWSGHATKWFHLSSRTSSDTTPVLCEQLQAISFDTYRPPPREMLVWSVMSYAMPGTSGKTLPAPASPGSQQTGLLTPTAPSSLRVNDPLATALPTPSRMPRCAARLQPPLYSQSIATRLQPRCAVPTLTLTYGLCSSRVGTATARVSRLRRRPEPRARQPWLPPEQSVVLQAG